MYWANFLHIYQPPTQTKRILERVVNESYRRIFKEMKEVPQAKLTMNITGGLTELLDKFGYRDVIADIRELLERGQLELTGTAMYHPLLPKLPDGEIVRQIKLDRETNKHYFGDAYKPRGFFPPEAAYDRRLAKIVAGLGFEWILAEELSYQGKFGAVKWDRCYLVEGIKIGIFFRERESSFKILSGQLGTAKLFEDYLGDRLEHNEYLLTAMDGETFGHHRPGMEKLLFELYRSPKIKAVTISELPSLFPQTETIKTIPSTWALMEKDVEKKMPFSRWNDPENEIHQLQWELTRLAIETVQNSEHSRRAGARQMLDKSLHSDQYWWASARPWWSLEMIERGANELKEVVLAAPDASEETKQKAQKLYYDIITKGFEWQRSGKVEEIARREDEEIRERTDQALPKLPPEEVEKMIANIRQEMLEVAKNQEYERAAQLRDRIAELEEYKGQG
jgi:alpha-amylase/alpha-mannosidase (GH57 family)